MYFNPIKYTVHYKNSTFNFASGVQTFIFDCGVENNIDKKYDIQTLIKYVYFVYQLQQKDDKKIVNNFCLINEMIVNFTINIDPKTKIVNAQSLVMDKNFKLINDIIKNMIFKL